MLTSITIKQIVNNGEWHSGHRWLLMLSLAGLLLLVVPAVFTAQQAHASHFVGVPGSGGGNNDSNTEEEQTVDADDPDCDASQAGKTDPGVGGVDAGSSGATGGSVSLYTGKERFYVTDLKLQGLFSISLRRQYDSRSEYHSPLGYGWAYWFDKRLYQYPDNSVVLRYGCGRKARFIETGGAYQTPVGISGILEQTASGHVFAKSNGEIEVYDEEGRLTELYNRQLHKLVMTYDPRGKLPLVGTSPYSLDPTQPMVTAYTYRLTRIAEQAAGGALTGQAIDFAYDDATGRLMTATANDGRVITYTHEPAGTGLTSGNLTQVTGLDGHTSTYQYTDTNNPPANHNITSIQEGAASTPFENTYDTLDRVVTQIHGNTLIQINYVIDYTTTQVTRTITDAQGLNPIQVVTTYEYNANGQVVRYTGPQGNQYEYDYDPSGNKIATRYITATGTVEKQIRSTYNSQGRKLTETVTLNGGEVITKTWTYLLGRYLESEQVVSSAASARVFRTEYTYNYYNLGISAALASIPKNIREIKRARPGGGFLTTLIEYDTRNRPITVTLPDGHKIRLDYVGSDYATRIYQETAAGTALPEYTRRYTYDPQGNIDTIADAKGNVTAVDFDSTGRLTRLRNALNEATQLTYTNDNLTQVEYGRTTAGGEGQILRLNYNTENRLTSIARKNDAGTEVTYMSFTYDSEGHRLSMTDAEARTTQYGYDTKGRLTTVTDAGLNTTTYTYDASDRLTQIQDALSRPTIYSYDALDRLTQVQQMGITPSAISQYRYDAVGNLITVTDPENNTTRYTVNILSQITGITQPLGQIEQYVYDARGRINYQVNARGHKIEYNYRPGGPLANIQYYDTEASTTATRTLTFGADNNGNITRIGDSAIGAGDLYGQTYDALNRPDTTTVNYIPGAAKTIAHTYDRYGNQNGLTVNDGAILSHNYLYNKLNQLTNVGLPGSQTRALDYYANDYVNAITQNNGMITRHTYKPNGPIEAINVINSQTTTLSQMIYNYDGVLNVENYTDNGQRHDFGYDGLDRLISAAHPAGIGLPTAEAFGYDKVGNREDPNPLNADVYQYDGNNRMAQSPGKTYGYDLDGNMTRRLTGFVNEIFSYNKDNRLTSYNDGATVVATYQYDPMGRRISKTVAGVTTWYLWDQGKLIAEYNGAGTRLKRYAYMPGEFAPTQMADANGIYDIHTDHLQTPKMLTNAAQQIVWSREQEAFGQTVFNDDADGNGVAVEFNIRFAGQYYDQETQLHYNHHRYYSPDIGRYTTADPLGIIPGLTPTPLIPNNKANVAEDMMRGLNHVYAYVGNNPLNWIDPFGLEPCFRPAPLTTDCSHYPPGSVLRLLCESFGTAPSTNCARGCLRDRLPPDDNTPPIWDDWYWEDHPQCWRACDWPVPWPFTP